METKDVTTKEKREFFEDEKSTYCASRLARSAHTRRNRQRRTVLEWLEDVCFAVIKQVFHRMQARRHRRYAWKSEEIQKANSKPAVAEDFFDPRCTDKARALCDFNFSTRSTRRTAKERILPPQIDNRGMDEAKTAETFFNEVSNFRRYEPGKWNLSRSERIRLALAKYGQWFATAVAITGVVLNNSQVIGCFPLWILSNSITAWYHARAGLWGLLVRDIVFIGLAGMGWWQWS